VTLKKEKFYYLHSSQLTIDLRFWVSSSETDVDIYNKRYIPEDSNLHGYSVLALMQAPNFLKLHDIDHYYSIYDVKCTVNASGVLVNKPLLAK
jgi:hypothetical protein